MDRNEVKEILSGQLEALALLADKKLSELDRCNVALSSARLAEVLLQYDVQAPAACSIGRDGIQIGPSYTFFDASLDLAPAKIEEREDAKDSDPAKSFPEAAARALVEWMHEQMHGDTPTEWTYGNEHDEMDEAASFLSCLLWHLCDKEKVMEGEFEDEDYGE